MNRTEFDKGYLKTRLPKGSRVSVERTEASEGKLSFYEADRGFEESLVFVRKAEASAQPKCG